MPKFRVEVSFPMIFSVEVEAEDEATARAEAEGLVQINPERYHPYEGCYEAVGCEEID